MPIERSPDALRPAPAAVPVPHAALWARLRREAVEAAEIDSLMTQPIAAAILRHSCFGTALAHRLSQRLSSPDLDAAALLAVVLEAHAEDPRIVAAAAADLAAVQERDAACPDLLTPFLWFKGFHALQAQRVTHRLWQRGRQHLARHLQGRISESFAVDIHPAARLGQGLLLDHATGIVIGETAVVGDDVSLLQGVTLGGTGKEGGDRHPKVRRGVLIGAGATVLGNIELGEGAKVGAGSIVLEDVAPHTTVVGVPARPVGRCRGGLPGLTMDQSLPPIDYAI